MEPSFKDDTLLARWLSGELSAAEEKALRERPDFADYERIADSASQLRAPDYDARAELARLKASRVTALSTKTSHLRPRPKKYRLWYAAAAAIALLLTAWFLLPQSPDTYSGPGAHLLADGSSLRLNAKSELAFREGDTRSATLSGEAFFEVKKMDKPFVVSTKLGSVMVLGTSFNVYERDGAMRVSCMEGKVSVEFVAQPGEHLLTPGKSVSLSPNGEVSDASISEEEALDWLDGRSNFKSRPLSEIFAELERHYDINIKLPAGFNLEEGMTTNFPNDNLEKALDRVFSALPGIQYELNEKTVIITPK